MKSTSFLADIFFVSVVCCFWNFRISAAVSDLEIDEPDTRGTWRNVELICNLDSDCLPPNTTCVEKKCQCQPNYVFNAEFTSCLKVATAYGDTCEQTAQCTAHLLAGGTCNDGMCSCVKGYHYLHGRCIKSSGLEEKCNNDDECYVNADYEALSCTNNVCQCSDGFYKREYRTCRRAAKEIGAECMINLDCTFNEKAQCNKKTGCFLESKSTDNTTLREFLYRAQRSPQIQDVPLDIVVGSNCTNDKDCEHLGAAACDAAGKCACKRSHFANDTLANCIPELGEKCEPDDKYSVSKSVCRNGIWSCKGATVPSRNNRICRKVTTSYNQSCVHDEQCYVFGPDALCVNKTRCLCNENSHYSEANMFCWVNRGVGEACKIDEDCYVNDFGSKLSCKESVCACPAGTHLNTAETACISDTAALGNPCTDNKDCGTLQNALCLNDTCACADNYFNLFGKCVSGIGANCALDTDCKTESSTCDSKDKLCSCQDGFVSPYAGLCVRVSSFGNDCQHDIQCSSIASGAICIFPEVPEVDEPKISRSSSINGECTCDTGHHYRYKRCYQTKVLQEPCDSQGECYVESSPNSVMCLKGVCICEWDAVQVNRTFCEMSASSKTGLSSLVILIILVVRFIAFV